MSALKEYFKKKKLNVKFAKAGKGQALNETKDSKSNSVEQNRDTLGNRIVSFFNDPPSVTQNNQSTQNTRHGEIQLEASLAAAEAALKRSQMMQQKNDGKKKVLIKPLESVMEEEKRKVLQEYKAKEEAEILKKNRELAAKNNDQEERKDEVEQRYTCNTLDITDSYTLIELKEMIEEGIRVSYQDNTLLMSALLIKNCNEEKLMKQCLNTLELVLSNLKTSDQEQFSKFRKIRKTKIVNKVLNVIGGEEFLNSCSFNLDENGEWFIFESEQPSFNMIEQIDYYLDVLKNADKFPLELDRNVVIQENYTNQTVSASKDEDDQFYKLSLSELNKEQLALTEAKEREETLMTKAMREELKPKLKINSNFTRIRIRVDSNKLVEITFNINETIADLRNWILINLNSDVNEFDLIYLREILDEQSYNKTFLEMKLFPSATLIIKPK